MTTPRPGTRFGAGASIAGRRRDERLLDLVHLDIADNGRGIPRGEREDVFLSGVRLDSTEDGTGLGLAIVRDTVRAFGGEVSIHDGLDGHGVRVRLSLPRGG